MSRVYLIGLWLLLAVSASALAAASKPTPARKPPATAAAVDEKQALQTLEDEIERLTDSSAIPSTTASVQQKTALLGLRAARHAERLLAKGDDAGFERYRQLFRQRLRHAETGLAALAERGIGGADFALGVVALHGMAGERDLARACRHFAAALDKGFGAARFRYAQCIESIDPLLAFQLFQEAARDGHLAAMERLGRLCLALSPPDGKCAQNQLTRAARGGRASAYALLGWMHGEGAGVTPNPSKALANYREAAQRGDGSAANNLGELHERGRGVRADPALALHWYRQGAEAGHPLAQFNAARLYLTGRPSRADLDQAQALLRQAADQGVDEATQLLEALGATLASAEDASLNLDRKEITQ